MYFSWWEYFLANPQPEFLSQFDRKDIWLSQAEKTNINKENEPRHLWVFRSLSKGNPGMRYDLQDKF